MKKLFLLVSVLAFLAANTLVAQKQNVLKMNLFSPIVRTANFQFERVIGEKKSLQLGFFHTGFKVEDTKFSGIGITPEFRFYPIKDKKAPDGFFVAPYLRYQNFKLTNDGSTSKASFSSIGGGLIIGYQTIIGDVISLEAFLGPSYTSSNITVDSGSISDFSTGPFDGYGLRGGVTLGIAF